MIKASEEEIFSIEEAKKKWGKKLAPTKKRRKARHKTLTKSTDGRSLRATGRNQQFNFRCRKGLKNEALEAAVAAGMSIAEWMEIVVEYGLKKRIDDLNGAEK